MVRTLFDIKCSSIFWICLLRQKKQSKNKKWGQIKLKSFHKAKETIDKINRQPTKWEKIFTNDMPKKLILKIHEQLIQLNILKKQTTQLKNG